MTREKALAIGRSIQMHPYSGQSLQERIADEIMAAYEAGCENGAKPVEVDDSYMTRENRAAGVPWYRDKP